MLVGSMLASQSLHTRRGSRIKSFQISGEASAKRYRDALEKVNKLLIVIGLVETVDNSANPNAYKGTTTL